MTRCLCSFYGCLDSSYTDPLFYLQELINASMQTVICFWDPRLQDQYHFVTYKGISRHSRSFIFPNETHIFFLRTLSHYNLFFLTDLHKIQYLRFLNWHLCGCTKQVAYLLVAWHLTYCSTTVCFKILLVKFVIAGMLWWRVYVRIFEGFPDSKSSYSRNNKHPTMPALFSLSKKNISECQVCSGYALKIQF